MANVIVGQVGWDGDCRQFEGNTGQGIFSRFSTQNWRGVLVVATREGWIEVTFHSSRYEGY